MAITKSAKKAIRSSARKRVFNLRSRRAMAKKIKDTAAFSGKGRTEQQEALAGAYQAIDKAVQRGVIKKNTAARKKSRLTARLKKTVS